MASSMAVGRHEVVLPSLTTLMDLTQIKYCVQSNSYITPLLHMEAALNPNLSGFFFPSMLLFLCDQSWFLLFSLLPPTQSLRISRSFHRTATEVTEKDEGEEERASPLSLSHSNQSRFFLHTETLTTVYLLKHFMLKLFNITAVAHLSRGNFGSA